MYYFVRFLECWYLNSMKISLVSSSAAMNLEKLKLFRHYYVMVRFIFDFSSTIYVLLSNGFFLKKL